MERILRITKEISTHWKGWYFDLKGVFRDPAGNPYTPGDIESTWWGRQLYLEIAGTRMQIWVLKRELQKRLERPRYVIGDSEDVRALRARKGNLKIEAVGVDRQPRACKALRSR